MLRNCKFLKIRLNKYSWIILHITQWNGGTVDSLGKLWAGVRVNTLRAGRWSDITNAATANGRRIEFLSAFPCMDEWLEEEKVSLLGEVYMMRAICLNNGILYVLLSCGQFELHTYHPLRGKEKKVTHMIGLPARLLLFSSLAVPSLPSPVLPASPMRQEMKMDVPTRVDHHKIGPVDLATYKSPRTSGVFALTHELHGDVAKQEN